MKIIKLISIYLNMMLIRLNNKSVLIIWTLNLFMFKRSVDSGLERVCNGTLACLWSPCPESNHHEHHIVSYISGQYKCDNFPQPGTSPDILCHSSHILIWWQAYLGSYCHSDIVVNSPQNRHKLLQMIPPILLPWYFKVDSITLSRVCNNFRNYQNWIIRLFWPGCQFLVTDLKWTLLYKKYFKKRLLLWGGEEGAILYC